MTDTKLLGVTPLSAPISPGDDSRDEWPTHKAKWGQGGLKVVKSIAERDAITPERRFNSMVLVLSDADGYANCYVWMGDDETGVKGVWEETALPGGIIVADTNGALPSKVKTLVLGPGLSVQKAGDQESGALVTLDGGAGGGSSLSVHMAAPNEQYGEKDVSEITLLPPLNVWADPDKEHGVKMEVKPGTFEPMHSPSFLAYLSEEEYIVGKTTNGVERAHHDGALWFDDVVWPAGAYIQLKRADKSYGIQEADNLDPNISGGMDYLVAFRVSMKGTAPNDGSVKIYLHEAKTPYQDGGILEDSNGQPMLVERQYKAGEKLGSLDVMGIVNAKGLQEFTCHVVDDFADDRLVVTDRTEGGTGLMIQALTKESKTGMGLLEFEADTQQSIMFSSHYMGDSQFDIGWIIDSAIPVKDGGAGEAQDLNEGTHLYNITPLRMGVEDGRFLIADDGSNICDFNFGKVFSTEKTRMMRGRDVDITLTLTNKDCGYEVAMMKWMGTPNEFTKKIIKARNNGTPIFEANWIKSGSFFISEDAVRDDYTISKNLQVPADANNYAVVIFPVQAQQPMTLKLKQFKVDVKNPFIGYTLHATDLLSEQHLVYSKQFKRFVQDNEVYASLRYTLNDAAEGSPMPVGIPTKGLADVVLDDSVNQVPTSSATGGEGALRFNSAGKVTITGQVRVWNEQGTNNNVEFWWSSVGPDGSMNKLDETVSYISAPANCKNVVANLKPFVIDVEAGDRFALRAKANKPDGAFLESTSKDKPLITVDVAFKELVPTSFIL